MSKVKQVRFCPGEGRITTGGLNRKSEPVVTCRDVKGRSLLVEGSIGHSKFFCLLTICCLWLSQVCSGLQGETHSCCHGPLLVTDVSVGTDDWQRQESEDMRWIIQKGEGGAREEVWRPTGPGPAHKTISLHVVSQVLREPWSVWNQRIFFCLGL